MKLSAKLLLSLLALPVAAAFSVRVAPLEASPPAASSFAVGERLTYDLKWGIVRAGTAVLEVNPITEIDGEEVYHFSLTVRTSGFVDTFYKVRDRIDGYVRTDLQGSVLYLVRKEAGKNLRDVHVTYDAEKGEAQYTNFGKAREPVSMLPGTFDPLSVFFVLREQPLEAGGSVELPISDGKDSSLGIAQVKESGRISVPAGRYRTILVEPDMKDVGGVFEKSGDSPMQIWLSNDAKRLPVRLSSKVAVGSFRADLVSVEQVPVGASEKLASVQAD